MYLLIIAGLVLLILGGELLVRGSVGVASRFGVSPLLIGLTLVGFGTSAPEMVTSIQAALADAPGIAIGNIVGSNIANALLILGVAALCAPIVVEQGPLKRDGLSLLAATVLFIAIGALVPLNWLVGLIFLVLLVAYMYFAYLQERAPSRDQGAALDRAQAAQSVDPGLLPGKHHKSLWLPIVISVGGLVLIVLGGGYLVDGSVQLAASLGVPDTIIGLTIVAIGTSMPELVTSVVASMRGQSDVALGNVMGSSLYNILGIGGATALVTPVSVPASVVHFDFPVLFGATLLIIVFAWTGRRVARREGLVLVACYVAYLVTLVG